MDNQTDNQLKNRIKDVFEIFEDPTADAGWLLLREKYPEEKKRRPIAWLWWSAAAILLLFTGIRFFKVDDVVKPQNTAYKSIKKYQQNTEGHKEQLTADQQRSTAPDNDLSAPTATIKRIKPYGHKENKTFLTDRMIINNEPAITYQQPIINRQITLPADTTMLASSAKSQPKQTVADSFRNANSIAAGTNIAAHKPVIPAYTSTTNLPKNIVDNHYDKKVTFGIYGSTFANYAPNSNTRVSAGAGVTADIPIGKGFKLSTGVALAQNSVSYGNGLSYGLVQYSSSNGTASSTMPTTTSNQPYNASLIGLDIPVNLKYDFNATGKTFVSAGFSSGTFISQSYSTGFPKQSTMVSGSDPNNFYFARVLNFSFGMNYPLGKTNSIIIEPFVKYPLGGLGEQQIKFGATGINLKFNFKPSQK